MADEVEKTEQVETEDSKTEKTDDSSVPAVDEQSRLLNNTWESLDADTKRRVFEYAQKYDEAERAKAKAEAEKLEEEADEEVDEKPASAAEAKRVAQLEKRLAAIEAEKEQRAATERNEQAVQQFHSTLDKVLADNPGLADEEDYDALKRSYVGHWLNDKPRDIPGSFKKFLEHENKRITRLAEKKKENFIREKIQARQKTRTATGSGAPPAKEKSEPTAKDFESGKLDDMVDELVTQ